MSLPFVGKFLSMFSMDVEGEATRLKDQRKAELNRIIRDGDTIATLARSEGWKAYIGNINGRLNALQIELENAKPEQVPMIQARVKELRYCAQIVESEAKDVQDAITALRELE